MKCIISHPNIAPYIKESVLAYQEEGVLDTFYTTYFEHPNYPFTKNLIRIFPRFKKDFRRRNIKEIELKHLKGSPYLEMFRVLSSRLLNSWIENRIWKIGEMTFDNWVARRIHSKIEWVHTYEHASLNTIRRAKKLNILSFYEQPSQHHNFLAEIIQQQLALYPELHCESTQLMLDEIAVKSDQRKDQELMECDFIICNSTFTASTLIASGVKQDKIIQIPYGFPPVKKAAPFPQNRKMTFMFAGNQCLRKGVHILYNAWKKCNFDPEDAELIVIGKNQLPNSLKKELPSSVHFIKNIPHSEMMDFYKLADVFVFPTLADGFGMVISEAMSKGVPVIATYNSGGPEVIENKINGYLVEAGNTAQLADQMIWCLNNREAVHQAGIKAMETAAAYPWKLYRKNLVKAVLQKVHERKSPAQSILRQGSI